MNRGVETSEMLVFMLSFSARRPEISSSEALFEALCSLMIVSFSSRDERRSTRAS